MRSTPEAGRQDIVEQEAVEGAVRTALSVEMRDGKVCVFMPPVKRLEDYLDLLGAIEEAAREYNAPIYVEGYAPLTTRD